MLLNTIYQGDTLETLKSFPDECIDFTETSPPYWGLRDYKIKGQYGLEPSYLDYVRTMVEVFHEVKRVTKKHGSLYLNLGDSYSGSNSGAGAAIDPNTISFKGKQNIAMPEKSIRSETGLSAKCLMMIPERIALGMIDDSWVLRNKIIWWKPNHMPSSVRDRLTNSYEVIYHFVKNKKYFYDLDKIREPHQYPMDVKRRIMQDKLDGIDPFAKGDETKTWRRDYPNQMAYRKELWASRGLDSTYQFSKEKRYKGKFANATADESEEFNSPRARNMREEARWRRQGETSVVSRRSPNKQDNVPGKNHATYEGFNDRWHERKEMIEGLGMPKDGPNQSYGSGQTSEGLHRDGGGVFHASGKNCGDVWRITCKPHPFAHFAVYPLEVCYRPMISSSPSANCKKCGTPRYPITDHKVRHWKENSDWREAQKIGNSYKTTMGLLKPAEDKIYTDKFIGYSDCGCGEGFEPSVILDPFAGSGTTLVMAKLLRRSWIGIDLSGEYIKIAEARLAQIDREAEALQKLLEPRMNAYMEQTRLA